MFLVVCFAPLTRCVRNRHALDLRLMSDARVVILDASNTLYPSPPKTQGAGATTSSDDYFQTVVIDALLSILKDQSLSSHHHTVIEAIMAIFKTQGLKCVTFLPRVSTNLPPILGRWLNQTL